MAVKTITADDQFLKDALAQRQAQQPPDPTTTPAAQDDTVFLQQNVPTADKNTIREQRLQDRAEKLKAANQERLDREQAAIDKAKSDAQADKNKSDYQKDLDASRDAVRIVQTNVSNLADKIGSIQTVGGIGLLLVILALLLFTVVQVNAAGDTRLKQIWYMLNGRATLQGSVTPSGVFGGAGTSFGPPTTTGGGPTTSTATTATGQMGGGASSAVPLAGFSSNGTFRGNF